MEVWVHWGGGVVQINSLQRATQHPNPSSSALVSGMSERRNDGSHSSQTSLHLPLTSFDHCKKLAARDHRVCRPFTTKFR